MRVRAGELGDPLDGMEIRQAACDGEIAATCEVMKEVRDERLGIESSQSGVNP